MTAVVNTIDDGDESVSLLLLDEEGAIQPRLEEILKEVFLRFATATPDAPASASNADDIFSNSKTLSREDLNRFTTLTNGEDMTDAMFAECLDFFDMLGERLTFKGFLQLYQLQTENDESETLNDLKTWGYDEHLDRLTPSIDPTPDEKSLHSATPVKKEGKPIENGDSEEHEI